MTSNEEILELAERVDEPIRAQLFEYVRLRTVLAQLTGIENPNEASRLDILLIADDQNRRRAARTASRMRWLSRQVFSRL